MTYDLWYWPTIQGRGEFVRLAMEAAGIAYRDRAREVGEKGLVADMEQRGSRGPFAPPYLDTGDRTIAQVADILAWLGERYAIAPHDPVDRAWIQQVQLTIADIVTEAHNVHHPVDLMAYYEDQKTEAARYAAQFRAQRMPKFLRHFEAAASANPGPFLMGEAWTYADTSLFQLVEGLRYAFPKRMAAIESDYPNLIAIRDAVAHLPGVHDYMISDRRLGRNNQGIFRHYPELDAA